MNSRRLNAVAALAGLSNFAVPAAAIDQYGVGKIEYESNCVGCHGYNGTANRYGQFRDGVVSVAVEDGKVRIEVEAPDVVEGSSITVNLRITRD